MKPTLILFLFLLLAFATQAQRGIRLTSRFSKRQKFILEGSRVIYQYTNNSHPLNVTHTRYGLVYSGISGAGMLKIVNDSTIQVGDEVIRTKDLMTLGQRNKGAWVGSFLPVLGGFAMMIGSSSRNSDTGQVTVDAPLLMLGVGCTIAGIADMASHYPKSMGRWRLEVVK